MAPLAPSLPTPIYNGSAYIVVPQRVTSKCSGSSLAHTPCQWPHLLWSCSYFALVVWIIPFSTHKCFKCHGEQHGRGAMSVMVVAYKVMLSYYLPSSVQAFQCTYAWINSFVSLVYLQITSLQNCVHSRKTLTEHSRK